MEILFMAFVIGALWQLTNTRPSPHAPAPCLWCPMLVVWTGRLWVHSDGEQYKPLSGTSAVHPACPDRIGRIAA